MKKFNLRLELFEAIFTNWLSFFPHKFHYLGMNS
jgi:hypothetical protein